MLRRILARAGWICGIVAVIALSYAAIIYIRSERILKTRYDAASTALTVPTDAASIARGEHLASAVTSCVLCHGEGLAGKVYVDMGPVGLVAGPNLTRGGVA